MTTTKSGPLVFETDAADLAGGTILITGVGGDMAAGDRVTVAFSSECGLHLEVVSVGPRAIHLAGYLTPWEYLYWKLEKAGSNWLLSTHETASIDRVRRLYRSKS